MDVLFNITIVLLGLMAAIFTVCTTAIILFCIAFKITDTLVKWVTGEDGCL